MDNKTTNYNESELKLKALLYFENNYNHENRTNYITRITDEGVKSEEQVHL